MHPKTFARYSLGENHNSRECKLHPRTHRYYSGGACKAARARGRPKARATRQSGRPRHVSSALWAETENLDWRFGAKAGVWGRVFDCLTADRDNNYLMLDSTLVRAHQQAATGKGGTKIRLWGVPEAD